MLDSMTPEKPSEESITRQHGVSRRKFLDISGRFLKLGGTAVTLDIVLSHIPFAPSFSKAFWEQLETVTLGVPVEQLKKEIEDRFQIQLVSPSTGVKEVEYSNEKKYPTIEWDNPRLKGLIGVLSELPPHFILPRKIDNEERKVRFALTNVPDWKWWLAREGNRDWAGFCACHAAENQLIVFDKKYLGQTFLESGSTRKNWFHEITHALTTPEIQKYVDSIGKPIGIERLSVLRKTFASQFTVKSRVESEHKSTVRGTSWIEEHYIKIEGNRYVSKEDFDRFGGDIDYFRTGNKGEGLQMVLIDGSRMVGKQAVDSWGEDYFKTPPPLKKDIEDKEDRESMSEEIKHKSDIGHGATNFMEFFSVAAEYYSGGRDNFVKTYEPFLGKERAEKLYDGMKREIFRGREY